MPLRIQNESKPDSKPGPRPGLAIPVLYLLLASIAAWVQGNKWAAFHHTRNLVALVLSVLALVIAATYLLRAFQARRNGGF